jgi:outer membrane protein assembly factor BamA
MQYHAIVSYSEKIERTIDLAYKDLGAGGGRYVLGVEASWSKNPFARFFGLGVATTESQETNYTSREGLGKLTVGINVTPDFVVMFTERYHDVRVEDGAVKSLPSTKQQFPTLPGIDGAQILGHGLTFKYDTRDSQLMPLQGTYAHLFGEFNQNVRGHDQNRWWRVTVDARHLVPHASNRMVFVSRVFFDGVIGQDENKTLETAIEGVDADGTPVILGTTSQIIRRGVPFYERPTLGGENTLRGFGRNRFVSNLAILVNLEERISVAKWRVFDQDIEFELAPFLDAGRVGRTNFKATRLCCTNVQLNPGVGIRLLARPYVVGRLDVGYGRDGATAFVGLDYPF